MSFWDKFRNKSKAFFLWLWATLGDEVSAFLRDNLDLALRLALEAASQLPKLSNAAKREFVIDMLKKNLGNVKFRDNWIDLLVQLAVTILKSQGKI